MLVKALPFFIFLFHLSFAYSQDLKKITKNHDNYYEIYHVIKSDQNIRAGSYKKINYDNKILEEGFYANNLKEGIWKIYYPLKKKPLRNLGKYSNGQQDSLWIGYYENGNIYSKGNYVNGKKVKVWDFFKVDGFILQTYDYDKRSVIVNNDSSFFPYQIIDDVRDTNIVVPPFFIGGSKYFFYEWNNIQVKLPPVRGELNESILVGILVTSNGKVEKYTIERGEYYDMNQAALEVIKSLPENWHPAELNGENLKTKILLDVNFRNHWVPVRIIPRRRF